MKFGGTSVRQHIEISKWGLDHRVRTRWADARGCGFSRGLETRGELAHVARVQWNCWIPCADRRGHGTDRAILLGLSGELPDAIEPETIERN